MTKAPTQSNINIIMLSIHRPIYILRSVGCLGGLKIFRRCDSLPIFVHTLVSVTEDAGRNANTCAASKSICCG